jgi:hypothetical protein
MGDCSEVTNFCIVRVPNKSQGTALMPSMMPTKRKSSLRRNAGAVTIATATAGRGTDIRLDTAPKGQGRASEDALTCSDSRFRIVS